MYLNTHSPIPLYQQLAERIRMDVENGVYPVNSKIPSENLLAEQYAIGRPTVRQATDLLVREGLLQRKRGSGTFVLAPAQQIDLFSLAGNSAAFSQSELDASSEIVQAAHRLERSELAVDIPIQSAVFCLKRLSRISDEPVLLEIIYLNAELFHGIERCDLNGQSLAKIVRETYFLEASSADQSFSIAYAGKTDAELLQVSVRSPLLQVQRTLHFSEYRAAIYCDIFCRTDRFHFSQTIHNQQPLTP